MTKKIAQKDGTKKEKAINKGSEPKAGKAA